MAVRVEKVIATVLDEAHGNCVVGAEYHLASRELSDAGA
jgi:hypothetical protein